MALRLPRRTRLLLGVGLLGVLAVAFTAFGFFGNWGKRATQDFPKVLTTKQVLEESPLLFTIPIDMENIQFGQVAPRNASGPYRIQGFAAGEDGTFWIVDPAHRLLHYSLEGDLLGTGTLSPDLLIVSMVARGSNAWVLAFTRTNDHPEPATLFRYSQSGEELARYKIPDDTPPRGGPIFLGESAQILMYREPTDIPQLWQVLNSSGMLDWKPLEGYSRGGTLYSARLDYPSNHFNRSATVAVGDVEFGISSTQPNMYLSGVCICHVNSDGSFYLFTGEWSRNRGDSLASRRSVLHYSAEGKPIARTPEESTDESYFDSGIWLSWDEHLALSADGSLYLLMAAPEEREKATHFEVRKLNFGP